MKDKKDENWEIQDGKKILIIPFSYLEKNNIGVIKLTEVSDGSNGPDKDECVIWEDSDLNNG